MAYRGAVRFRDLEGGLWILECQDGRSFQLEGGDAKLRNEGQEVLVKGDLAEDAMGIGMTGPVLRVSSWSPA